LQSTLEQGLLDTITRGVGPDELTKTIMKEFNKEFGVANTLVRTELTHVYVQAAAERYQDAGCEYYEVLSAQSDDECFDMNGTIIRFSEMVEGENCPPFHPNCRCTILPVIKGR
jgi:SPP1 gp7 family putative phage head morphogenesis protein